MRKTRIVRRIQKLVGLVINLQKNAPEGIGYSIEYSGSTNTLSFLKFHRKGGNFEILQRIWCYPEECFGIHTFEEFEKQIIQEMEKIKNA